jgi:hypothetical protein
MFPPEAPHPTRHLHKKPHPTKKKEGFPWGRVLQVLLVIGGIAAVAGLIFFGPKQKRLVCNEGLLGRSSLTSFGSCTEQ